MIRPKSIPFKRKIPVKTKSGVFLLEMTERGLYAVRFPGQYRLYTPGMAPCTHPVCTGGVRIITNYFKDPHVRFDSAKPDLTGFTPFQRKVYAVLRKIRAGRTVTYGELAKRAGYPGAARAVGTAMKKNRLPIVIPCHRVIPASGGLGEYSAGKKWKRFLLEHEQYSRATCCGQRST